jgi:hypothetical protein
MQRPANLAASDGLAAPLVGIFFPDFYTQVALFRA